MLLRNLFENLARTGKAKAAVLGWGRGMGHKGHMFLASSVITQAKEHGSDPYFVVSNTVGKDDPIQPDEKMAIYKKVFPQSGHIFHTATEEMPGLVQVLAKLQGMGYTDVTVVVGADQVKAMQFVTNYNGKPDKSGNIPFTFNSLNVISRQETNDPSRDQEGPRATPMRAVLMDPAKSEEEKFAVWRDAMNPELSDEEVMDLMHKAEQRMRAMVKPKKGLKEMDKNQTPPGRDGHVNHGTYGSRDKKDPDAGKKQYTAKGITANQATTAATDILSKAFKDSQRVDPRTGKKMVQKGVAEGLNEFAQGDFNGSDDSNDLQLYLNVAKKLNMKKYKPSTAHDLIAKKMAELVDAVDDEKVDWARHMARKAQGLPSMLDQQGVAEACWKNYKQLGMKDKGGKQVPNCVPKEGMEEGEEEYGPEYQAMVKRVGQMAAQGPRKTVWDPVKRVYKTVPINPPKDAPVKEKMMPASNFVGSKKNKLGSAGQLKATADHARAGDLVGGSAEESLRENWEFNKANALAKLIERHVK